MASNSGSHEKNVFRKHFGSLTQCLTQQEDLIPLVMQFYSEGMIGEQLRNQFLDAGGATSAQQKAAKFLSAVERYVADNPAAIEVVIQLLMDSSTCKYVADMMQLDLMSPASDVTHYSPNLSKRQGYSRLHSLQQQNSLPEAGHSSNTETFVLNRGTSFEPYMSAQPPDSIPLTSSHRPPLSKHSTFPQYYHPDLQTASTTSHFSKISLTEKHRDRSSSFPIDAHSPTSPRDEKSFTTHVPSALSSSIHNLYSQPRHEQEHTYQLQSNTAPADSTATFPPVSTNTLSDSCETLPLSQPSEKRVHLQCEVMNAKTAKLIKCKSSTRQNHPLFRSIKLKVKKYDTVSPNTPLQLRISADQACHVYVINIGSAGDETLLIPNEFETNSYLEAERQMLFPPSGAGYEFELDENCGTETIILLAYKQPLQKNEQAMNDYGRLRQVTDTSIVDFEEESTQRTKLHRGIKIKAKQPKQEVIGFLEIQFSVSV